MPKLTCRSSNKAVVSNLTLSSLSTCNLSSQIYLHPSPTPPSEGINLPLHSFQSQQDRLALLFQLHRPWHIHSTFTTAPLRRGGGGKAFSQAELQGYARNRQIIFAHCLFLVSRKVVLWRDPPSLNTSGVQRPVGGLSATCIRAKLDIQPPKDI